MTDLFEYGGVTNVLANVFAVFLQEQMKGSDSRLLRWVNERTPWANRALAAVLAALTSAGISYQYSPALGELHVTGITVENAAKFLTTVGGNYAVQWFLYKVSKRV